MKKCLVCGVVFKDTSVHNNQKFCTKKCRLTTYKTPRHETKHCEICFETFIDTTKKSQQRFCCKDCYKVSYNRARKMRYIIDKDFCEERKQYSREYRKKNRDILIAKSLIYYKLHPEKFNKKPQKFKNYINSSHYNQEWRKKNLKYDKLSDKIKWRLKTTIPISIIREKYDELKNLY